MVTFKFNDKQYTTNNLEKKLKRLGLTMDQIIICKNGTGSSNYEKEVKEENKGLPFCYWNTKTNLFTGTGYVDDYNNLNDSNKLFLQKRGEDINDWILIKGEPIFPIELINGFPKLK